MPLLQRCCHIPKGFPSCATKTLSTSLLLPFVWTCQRAIIISFQNLQVISRGKISFYVQPLASIPKVLLPRDIYKLLPRWQCIVSYSDHFKQSFPSCLSSWTPPLQGNAPIQQLLLLLLRAPKPAQLGAVVKRTAHTHQTLLPLPVIYGYIEFSFPFYLFCCIVDIGPTLFFELKNQLWKILMVLLLCIFIGLFLRAPLPWSPSLAFHELAVLI